MNEQDIIGGVIENELLSRASKLYHYTTGRGLEGILEGNMLWATHARDLNDSQELLEFQGHLARAEAALTRRVIEEEFDKWPKLRRAAKKIPISGRDGREIVIRTHQ